MSKKKKEFSYAETFDRLMGEIFESETFKTQWSLFAGSPYGPGGYVTRRSNGRPLTKTMTLVGRGISNALAEFQKS